MLDLPSLSVSLVHGTEATPTAGQPHTLLCISTVPSNFNGLPTVSWKRTNGEIILSDATHNIETPTNNGSHVVSDLSIQPLKLSDSGEYECFVEFDIFGSTESVKSSASSELHVTRKCTYKYIHNVMSYVLL